MSVCSHLKAITDIRIGTTHVCEECVKQNGTWLHLRTCQTCGATLCCDDSPARHMTQHFHATAHPVVASAEPGEQWLWCYVDNSFAEY
ncbi:UBP-type zinc finger domain-containing protein [Chitinophaga sp.]|uniref:UBP-type zinc finger domain-containing protein n=1 Tax=Chitinophaga sp. TaxID=1869181 RepID=UPI002F959FA9